MKIIKNLYIKVLNNKKYINYLRKNGGVEIGFGCQIDKSVFFGSEPYLIKIGNKVRVSRNVSFITHDGGMWVLRNLDDNLVNADKFGRIIIGNNVNIGWNVIIMPNVTIGDNVIIGAGAIVTKDIPQNSVAVGIPARVIETIDEYKDKNKNKIFLTKNMNINEKKEYLINYFKL